MGPDGRLYVCDRVRHRINQYDGASGRFLPRVAEGGGLVDPNGLVSMPADPG